MEKLRQTFTTSKRLLGIVWNIDRKLFIASIIAILIPSIIPFVNIYIYKLFIDQVVKIISSNSSFVFGQFLPLIIARIVTYFLQDAAFRTQDLVSRLLWTKVPIDLNQMMFKKISGLDVHYYENDKFRTLLEKVRDSYSFQPQRLIENLLFSMQSFVTLLIAMVTLVRLQWWFTILILIVAIPEFILQNQQSKLAWGIWNQESTLKKRFHYLSRMLEGHREHKEVKLFSLAERFLKELKNLQMGFYKNNTKLAKRNYYLNLIFKTV